MVSTNGDVCVDLSSVCSSGCCMVAPPAAAAGRIGWSLVTGHWEAGARLSKVWCQHQELVTTANIATGGVSLEWSGVF